MVAICENRYIIKHVYGAYRLIYSPHDADMNLCRASVFISLVKIVNMPAVSLADVSRIVGYQIKAANFSVDSPNLPQNIALVAEMNTANQAAPLTPFICTSRAQGAAVAGWGSPVDIALRDLFPANGGGGANGIPVTVYPVLAAVSSTANTQTITVTGTPTANVAHNILIGGRQFLEGGVYGIVVVTADTVTTIATKIKNAINAVLGCPFTATSAAGVVTLTANWTGLTSQSLTVGVLTNGTPAGISYAIAQTVAGAGTPSIGSTLASFGNIWYTMVINGIGLVAATIGEIQAYNGNANNQTGQYAGIILRPAIYLTGTVIDTTTTSADTVLTTANIAEMSIATCPAPLSLGLPIEAATNMAVLFANISQNTPNIDVQGLPYADMPLPAVGNIPATALYLTRDAVLKMGMSTVDIVNNQYVVQDFATTYHPVGETPPAFRYCRDLMADFNIKFQFYVLQAAVILNKQIANDNDNVEATNVVKPKNVVSALVTFANNLVKQGLITDAPFMISTITVVRNTTNPNRFDIAFSYKRSGVVRIVSTTASAGF